MAMTSFMRCTFFDFCTLEEAILAGDAVGVQDAGIHLSISPIFSLVKRLVPTR